MRKLPPDGLSKRLDESRPGQSGFGAIARRLAAVLMPVTVAAMWGWGSALALARWQHSATTRASIAYNQGIAFDRARGDFFFDGVSSTTNSGLYRTNSRLARTGADTAVIPATREGYNHAGDLSFDPLRQRVLLPLECYYPAAGGNTCGTGAIGVADPVTLRGTYSEVISYVTGVADRSPRLLSVTPRTEIAVLRSRSYNESDGLAATGSGNTVHPLGGVLHWLMLPVITPSSVFSRILSYLPPPPPPREGLG
jgi:hypothetical protein